MTRFLTMLLLFASALPLLAHHSFIAEYNGLKPITLTGTVTRIDWANPHIWIYLNVKDAGGSITQWGCEGGAPNSLTRHGWTKDTLKPGDPVTIEGYPAKDMAHTCLARYAQLPDGRKLLSSNSESGK